jgi:hypothetical protein
MKNGLRVNRKLFTLMELETWKLTEEVNLAMA